MALLFVFMLWSSAITINMINADEHGIEGVSSSNRGELWIVLDREGYDCLKQIHTVFNSSIDKTYSPEQEKQVLLDIYHSTNGQNWYNQTGWTTPNKTSHCYWYGICCHANTSYVKSILIPYNNLQGFLPSNLWKLRNLLSFCFPGNPKLQGRMENIVYGNMSELRIILINGASISGNIPQDMAKMVYLERFLACPMIGGGLSGPLPHDLGNLTELRLICLEGNSFSGEIPRSISKLKKLFYLDLHNAPGLLSGHVEDLLSLKSMEELLISGVKLQGKIWNMPPKLTYLVLAGNELQGTLPPLENFPRSLVVMDVANNKLTGDVPGQLFFLPVIVKVDVSQNLFLSVNNGSTFPPYNSTQKTQLKCVSLAGNRKLSFHLESFLRALPRSTSYSVGHFAVLNISFCDLTGSLPGDILIQFNSLTICDLRGNRFSGRIPEIIQDYSYLSYLDVSHNNFSGDLPLGINSVTSLQYLDISGNPEMYQDGTADLGIDFSTMPKPDPAANYSCAEGKLLFNNGRVRLDPTFYNYKYCICDAGFYGDSGLCKKCMPGSKCEKPIVVTIDDLKPSFMKIKAGYWPSPSPTEVTHLVRCPLPKACNPSGECTCTLQTRGNLTSYSANHLTSSMVTSCNTSCVCHHGNTDRFCSRCMNGFYKISAGLCIACPKTIDNISFYIFIPIFAVTILVLLFSMHYFKDSPRKAFILITVEFILLLILTLLEMVPTWVFKLDIIVFMLCMKSKGNDAYPLIKIGVFYLQTLDYMVAAYQIWPRQIFSFQQSISSFWNLRFASISCEFPILFDPIGKFAFILLLPFACVVSIAIYLVLSMVYYTLRRQDQENYIHNTRLKSIQLTMKCLNFVYFPIVEATLSTLRPCSDDNGVHFMPKIPWIECNSQTYHTLTIMGGTSVAIYVIGFPVILMALMRKYYKKRGKFETDMEKRERDGIDSWLGSVYLQYKEEYQQFFEFVVLFRRLMLAIALSILASRKSLQTVAVSLILVISAIIQFHYKPYDNQMENRSEFAVLFVLFISFVVLRLLELDKSFSNDFVWMVMMVNGCTLLALLICILYAFGVRLPSFKSRCNATKMNTNDQMSSTNVNYEPIS